MKRLCPASAVLVAVVAALAVSLALAAPAFAHATLEHSSPSPHTTIARPPSSVTLTFDETVTALPGALRVYAPDGGRVDTGVQYHPHGDGPRLAVRLADSDQRGTYLVSWRVVSADSHPVSGAFTFSVGHRSAAPAVTQVGNDPVVAVLMGVGRWAGFLGLALLVGGWVFLRWCWPDGAGLARPRRLLLGGAALLEVGVVTGLALQGPYDAGLGVSAATETALWSQALQTTSGRALVVRGVLTMLMAALLLRRWGRGATARRSRPATPVAVLLGLALLVTFAVAGHAVAAPRRWLMLPSDVLHAGAMTLWLGGLALLLSAPGAGRTARPPDLPRFSRVAAGCVGLLVVTGVLQSWTQVGAWGALVSTTYGVELSAKIGLVALVLLIARSTRTRLRGTHPASARAGTAEAPGGSEEGLATALRRTVLLEAAGVLAVLALTSALVATQPARTAYHPSVATTLHLGHDVVVVSAVPDGRQRMDLHLVVVDRQGRRVDPPEVAATVSLTSRHIGPLPVRLARVGPGHRRGTVTVPVLGDWTLVVTVRTSPIDEYSGTVDLPVR